MMSILNCGDASALESASRIVCGSWSSELDFKGFNAADKAYASVKEKIEDAMRDPNEEMEDLEEEHEKVNQNKKNQMQKRNATQFQIRIKGANHSGSSNSNNNIDLIHFSGIDF